MRHVRVYFYRDGQEITGSRFNGMALAAWGLHSGRIGKATCFESVNVGDEYGRTFALTERDFDGPVSVKVWEPGAKPAWFGLAAVESIEQHAEGVR